MKKLVVLMMVIILTGCSMTVTKVSPPIVKNTETFDASYDDVWLAAVDWFAANDIVMDKVEKESGLLTAKHELKTLFGLTCDKVEYQGLVDQGKLMTISLNSTVRNKGENKTRVRVNIDGEFVAYGYDGFAKKSFKRKGECYSNGDIEQKLFEYIKEEIN